MSVEGAKIATNNLWHRHSQRSGKIIFSHLLLALRRIRKIEDLLCHAVWTAGFIEVDGQAFIECHVAEIFNIGRDDGHAVFGGDMSYSAAASGGGVRQY